MNQILLTENENNKNKNKNIKIKETSNVSDGSKKIIRVFGIVILIFGIALTAVYAYKLVGKDKQKSIELPNVSLEYIDYSEYVTLVASAEAGIDKIIYNWNDEEIQEMEMYGRTSQEQQIMLPKGTNILKVQVIDTIGQIGKIQKEFKFDLDKEKPIIETQVQDNAELKILATDETEISYISYKWNEEEENIIKAENAGDTIIETSIEIRRGKNTLTIKAVDASENTEILEKTFNGVNKPIIEVKKDNDRIYMKVSHDIGLKKIEFSVNGNLYTYDENYSGYNSETKEIEYYFDLKEGENTIIILATSMENTQETYKGKCNYVIGE